MGNAPRKRYRDLDGPFALPIIGNALQIRPYRVHRIMEAWADRYGPLYRMRIGPFRLAVLADPASIGEVLAQRPTRFRRLARFRSVVQDVGVPGIFVLEGQEWVDQRPSSKTR